MRKKQQQMEVANNNCRTAKLREIAFKCILNSWHRYRIPTIQTLEKKEESILHALAHSVVRRHHRPAVKMLIAEIPSEWIFMICSGQQRKKRIAMIFVGK